MQFELQVGQNPLAMEISAVVCPCLEGKGLPPGLTNLTAGYELPELSWILSTGEFRGRKGERVLLHTGGRTTALRMLLVGLGKPEKLGIDALRDAIADAMRGMRDIGCTRVAFLLPSREVELHLQDTIAAYVEATHLGLYSFTRYKTGLVESPEDVPTHSDPVLCELHMLAADVDDAGGAEAVRKALELGEAMARAANISKDICNEPSNVMTPRELTKECLAVIGGGDDFVVEVLDETDIRRKRMNLVWAVAKGSKEAPRVVLVSYRGNRDDSRFWGIVGKGVTFDSGGLSLKPSTGMFQMKRDLTGAGVVVGLLDAMRRLRPKINVAGLIVAAENMPDALAFKPGDIYASMSGKTVEIFSTDAEGRMLVADSLTYLQQKLEMHGIITIATLTDAALSAVGPRITPVLGTDRRLVRAIVDAGARCGERFWEMPFEEAYMPRVKSHFADIKTDSPKPPALIAGAMFLREFVNDGTPWLHLDIAGTAASDAVEGTISRGATGVAVRSLLRFLLEDPLAENR
ncbi:MAG: leucyl aminopeptidase family protein [Candidatus Schekmanbacteria bacterium]|nr:leucyl aminopeptidase family protein [Candidatus Schekmanbacteria bacterium]